MANPQVSDVEDDWKDVAEPKAGAASEDGWEDVESPKAPTDEEIESAYGKDVTPKMRTALKSGVAKMQPPTKFEAENARPYIENFGTREPGTSMQPQEYLGLPNTKLVKNAAGGAWDLAKSTAKAGYDLGFGEVNPESGNIEKHGLGGVFGMDTKGEFHPWDRAGALTRELITDPAVAESDKASEEAEQGHGLQSFGHSVAAGLPLIGPWAAGLSERAGTGDVGGAGAEALGQIGLGMAAEKLPEIKDSLRGKALEHPDVAAQKALRPPQKKAIRAQDALEGARPYLEGATSLEELQAKTKAGQKEVWKPITDALAKIGEREVEGPDGRTTLNNMEDKRLELSAERRKLNKMVATDRATALQKDADLRANEVRYKAYENAIDKELATQGIDGAKIRKTFAQLKGIETLIEGRNTLSEADRAYGLGRIMEDFHITKPLRSLWKGVIPGVQDIAAGRPWFKGKPTDVAVAEGFRPGTGGAKPDFTTPIPQTTPLPAGAEAIEPQLPAHVRGPQFEIGSVARPSPNASSLWEQQIGEPPKVGFEEPATGGKPLAPGEATYGPTAQPTPLGPIQPPEGPMQGPQGGQQLEIGLPEPQHELFNLSHPAPTEAPKGLGQIGEPEVRPEVGKLGKIETTPAEKLKEGDTFVDEKGDPRRITEITEDGTIKTADHTLRDYHNGEIKHVGELNSPKAQLARGGMMHPADEAVEHVGRDEDRYDLGEIGGEEEAGALGRVEEPKAANPKETSFGEPSPDEMENALPEEPRTTEKLSPPEAIEALKKRIEEVNKGGLNSWQRASGETRPRNVRILKPGEAKSASLYDTSFLLDDGSMLTGDWAHRSHMQLAKEIGQDYLNDANAVRVVTPDSFELHGMPSEAQISEMSRLLRELPRTESTNVHNKSTVYWDFYPREVRGYSADAIHELHETDAGSFADFRRAMDGYYAPAAVEFDRVVNGKGVFDKPIEEGKLDAGRAKVPTEEEEGAAAPEEQNKFGPDDVRISTRTPTAKGATENPHTTPLSVNLDAVHETEGLPEKLADVVKKYPDMKKALGGVKDPKVALERFVQHISDNLEWLHNQMPPEVREITRKWYDSANTMAKEKAGRYGYEEKQMAGVMASLSPQKDWNMNVSLADRVADTVRNKSDVPFSDEMLKKAKALTAEGSNASMKSVLKNIKGKTLGEIKDPIERAAWIRLYDEAHNSRSYDNIAPNGKVLGKATNVNGAESKVAWGSLNEIAKAASILEDGSRENISKQLGEMHKVRNFYNNIADPGSEHPDVTVDTHAVAAGHIQPFSGNSHEVGQNFGGPGSAITGVNGTYPLYAEAYRRAAEKLGIKPRELQSIVWEQVRDLFPAEWKTKANAKKVADIWGDYGKGKIKIGEARQQIVDLAGGFKKPEWLNALD